MSALETARHVLAQALANQPEPVRGRALEAALAIVERRLANIRLTGNDLLDLEIALGDKAALLAEVEALPDRQVAHVLRALAP